MYDWCITIFGWSAHGLSILFVLIATGLGLVRHWGFSSVSVVITNVVLCVQLGNCTYETVLLFLHTLYPTRTFYLIVTTMLYVLLYSLNRTSKFILVNKLTILLFSVWLGCFILMYWTGWFNEFTLYRQGLVPDPHNFVWTLGKLCGFLWPVSMLKDGRT